MAHVVQASTNIFGHAVEAISHGLKAAGRNVNAFLVHMMESNSRMELIERMNNLTDTELATKYGINRDGIVAYVFRDKMY